MKENSTLNQFNERINNFWKKFYNNPTGIYSEVHTREKTGAIDTSTSITKTRCCSIWTAKGDGRKCVFVLDFNFSTFYKGFIGETNGNRVDDILQQDPGISNVNVAITRAMENLVLCYELVDDDKLLQKMSTLPPTLFNKTRIVGTKSHKAPEIVRLSEYKINQLYETLINKESLQFANYNDVCKKDIHDSSSNTAIEQVDQKYHYILKAIFSITFWQGLSLAQRTCKSNLYLLVYNYSLYGDNYVQLCNDGEYQRKLQGVTTASTLQTEKLIYVQHNYIRIAILRFLQNLQEMERLKLRTPIDMIIYFFVQQLLSKGINTSFTETMLEECLQVLQPSMKNIMTHQDEKLQKYLQKVEQVYPIINTLNNTIPNKLRFHMTQNVVSITGNEKVKG